MSRKRRTLLKGIGASALTISGVSTVSANPSKDKFPLEAFRKLVWAGNLQQAKELAERYGLKNKMSKESPSDVSTQRYGDPSEDSSTNITISVTEISSSEYDVSCYFELSEWDNNIGDSTKEVGSRDSAVITWDTTYWTATEQTRSNVDGVDSDSRMTYEQYKDYGPRIEYDEPGTPTDGNDQSFQSGFSTLVTPINRSSSSNTEKIECIYCHTYNDGSNDVSWDFLSGFLEPGPDVPYWTMNATTQA
ncbi:hypothetical protein [Halorussus aquaticus]|uniref:Uncharacterized protein n=1 Tax=Halorussus aquaticus TaxID=2953748 RepID=A0ABD5Q3M1_9EURY|nr:hypothetical protein [Halorussus aquaticus]